MTKTAQDLVRELAAANARIADLERQVQSLSRQAFVDEMTGLPNYRSFCQRLDQLVAEFGRGRDFCMVMVDVDHFKKVNDTYGHSFGDDVLRHVAETLQNASRQVDFVGRYGGEEFCMLLPDSTIEGAKDVAERVRQALVRAPFAVPVTASFGVCQFRDGLDRQTLKERADAALYKAKESGRNKVVCCGD